jgi:hypothetical protein
MLQCLTSILLQETLTEDGCSQQQQRLQRKGVEGRGRLQPADAGAVLQD